jgi:hypothetical protein
MSSLRETILKHSASGYISDALASVAPERHQQGQNSYEKENDSIPSFLSLQDFSKMCTVVDGHCELDTQHLLRFVRLIRRVTGPTSSRSAFRQIEWNQKAPILCEEQDVQGKSASKAETLKVIMLAFAVIVSSSSRSGRPPRKTIRNCGTLRTVV